MWDHLKVLFDTTMFSPHGICLLWEPELLLVHIVSDAVIALSYFSIPFALAYFVFKRRDVEFGWVFWAFAIFIMACGVTHLFSIYTLWVPVYGLEGLVKAVTAIASLVTAALLWPLIPKLLTIPSPGQLRLAYSMLEAEARQRREAEAMLGHAQKLEAIGQLTGGVAHDFNNLLTVIAGNLEMAQRALAKWNESSRERIGRAVEHAYAGAERAATLTNRLLAFARKQPFDPKVVNPDQLISGMSDFFRRTVGETIELKIVGAQGLWNTETDPNQLEAALLNLVVNARDAMPNGGKLTIETSNSFIDEQYAKQNADVVAGPYVSISVTDNGVGMDQTTLERAFEPFFSTKETGQGTGLGLSQVYGFAKQSGGFAAIDSRVGEGTSVKIYLPRTLLASTAQIVASDTDGAPTGAGETILVVEDDEQVRRYIFETLVELNYQVIEARDAIEANEVFNRFGQTVDLLLTDVVMPGKNGRLLSEELVRRNPELKVLFMTGYSRDALVHHGRLDAGVSLLQKPVTQKDLAKRLRALLRVSAGRQRPQQDTA
jgi:signal transduction histidine kinase/ActR/RegA family two-component response regulator